MRAGGPAKTPADAVTGPKRITLPPDVTPGAVRLDIAVDRWRFAHVVDADPPTGALREIAATITAVTGRDSDVALAAVFDALTMVGGLEAAA